MADGLPANRAASRNQGLRYRGQPSKLAIKDLREFSEKLYDRTAKKVFKNLGFSNDHVFHGQDLRRFTDAFDSEYRFLLSDFETQYGQSPPNLLEENINIPASLQGSINQRRANAYANFKKSQAPNLPNVMPEDLHPFVKRLLNQQIVNIGVTTPPLASPVSSLPLASTTTRKQNNTGQRLFEGQQLMQRQKETPEQKAARELFIEQKRLFVMQQEIAVATAASTAEQQENQRAMLQNATRAANRAARQGTLAVAGIGNVKETQIEHTSKLSAIQSGVDTVKDLSSQALVRADEILGLSRDIKAGVNTIKAEVGDLKRMWNEDRITFFKSCAQNEVIMYTLFFILHTQFPITTEIISNWYTLYFLVPNRIRKQAMGMMNGEYSISIGSLLSIPAPHLLSYTFLQYTKLMVDARLGASDAYTTAFSTTLETGILYTITNARKIFLQGPTGPEMCYTQESMPLPKLPSLADVRTVIQTALVNGREMLKGELALLESIDPNWADPAKLATVLAQYGVGKLQIVVGGVTSTIGAPQLIYQCKNFMLGGAETMKIISWLMFKLLGSTLATIWNFMMYYIHMSLCMVRSQVPKLMGGQDYAECMKTYEIKEKTAGGGPNELALIRAQAPHTIEYQLEVAHLMQTVGFLSIQNALLPNARVEEMINLLSESGGAAYETMMEGNLGFTYFPYPLLTGTPPIPSYTAAVASQPQIEWLNNTVTPSGGYRKSRSFQTKHFTRRRNRS